MTLAAWLHDLSPFLWEFSPGVGLRWYGLSYALGFVAGYLALRWLSKRGATPIPRDRAGDVILLTALCLIVGGRLFYVLIYNPSLFVQFTGTPPWWGVLAINQGGMASHGGMIGVIVAAVLIARGFKDESGVRVGAMPVLHVCDVYALLAPFGLLMGRIANLINGELLGKIVAPAGEPAPWWAVKYPQEVFERPAELSDYQLTELPRLFGMHQPLVSDQAWDAFVPRYEDLVHQLQAHTPGVSERLAPLINARHPSQLYQALAEGIVVGLIVWLVARRPRKPGMVTVWFLVGYGVLRVVTEFWRLPDAQFGAAARIAGLSRGQWLSVLMVVSGLVLYAVIRRRSAPAMGGWGGRAHTQADTPA